MPKPHRKLVKIALYTFALYSAAVLFLEGGTIQARLARSVFKPLDDWIGGIIKHTSPSWQKATDPYTHEGVLRTQKVFTNQANVLMVFDGESGDMHTYSSPFTNTGRFVGANFMIAQSLFANFPERFRQGAPMCQILFSVNDYPSADVREIDFPSLPEDVDYAPVLQFGSVPRDLSLLYPVVIKEMPFVKILGCLARRGLSDGGIPLGSCFFEESSMPKLLNGPNTRSWEDMKSQIIWRGADYNFLPRLGVQSGAHLEDNYDNKESAFDSLMANWDTLPPRWKAITLSLGSHIDAEKSNGEELPWIDAKFFMKKEDMAHKFARFDNTGDAVVTSQYVTQEEQMNYKYHIDLGGGGGTSWTGMLSKLAMPGVLFHHETITRDWFYDEVVPWVHYIPVKMDLSDLREKFEWAEAHPIQCKKISDAATGFVQEMSSEKFMKETYVKYLVEHLGEVANAYKPGSETLESIITDYEANGMQLEKFSTCDAKRCVQTSDERVIHNVEIEEY